MLLPLILFASKRILVSYMYSDTLMIHVANNVVPVVTDVRRMFFWKFEIALISTLC